MPRRLYAYRRPCDACVVHEHVEAVQIVRALGHHPLDVLAVRDVGVRVSDGVVKQFPEKFGMSTATASR